VVSDVFGHHCGKIETESHNFYMNVDEKCTGGPTTKDDGAVGDSVEVEGNGAARLERMARDVIR
jgi:hypothetical protein